METEELIGACVRLETLNDLIKVAESEGRTDTMQWLLGQLHIYEGHLSMHVRRAEARIANLDGSNPLDSEGRAGLQSAVERAKNILALVQARKPRTQTRPPQSRGGRGR